MSTIDHSTPLPSCKGPDCRALQTWKEKCHEAERRLDIAEKAALACPRSEPPKEEGWYFMHVRLPGKPVRVVYVHESPKGILRVSHTPQDEPPGTPLCELDPTNRFWAGSIAEPVTPME